MGLLHDNLAAIRPGIRIFDTSARTGAGLDAWMDYLAEQRRLRASGRPSCV
jgi:Ni2+-binding GTPase involved in maturation of urease and hydrogenase